MAKRKRRYKTEEMRALVARYENSGLGRKAFCVSEKINEQTFYYWFKKLKREAPSVADQNKLAADFVPIAPPANFNVPSVITIELPTSIRVTIPLEYATADLCALIRGLSC